MDKNERKKKMRKGLLIVGIVIAALLVVLDQVVKFLIRTTMAL